ncbi:MAG: hypothetical protein WCD70_14440 [Alphaproteobacteria bacterium]
MKDDIAARLKDRATCVLGAQSWDRCDKDPTVLSAIKDATHFLEQTGDQLGDPQHISGGMTSNPEIILSLQWRVRDGISGVHIAFKGNDICDVRCGGPPCHYEEFPGLSVAKALELDLPRRFRQLRIITGLLNKSDPAP